MVSTNFLHTLAAHKHTPSHSRAWCRGPWGRDLKSLRCDKRSRAVEQEESVHSQGPATWGSQDDMH